jgi:hypothetical protein
MSSTKTIIDYPVNEFDALLRQKLFNGQDFKIKYVIETVGGDPLDRHPGYEQVTRIRLVFDGHPAITDG